MTNKAIITVNIYPERYMFIERHTLNDRNLIVESHILNKSGEWIEEYDADAVELPPVVAYFNDADALKALIARLQEYVDNFDKAPKFEVSDCGNA